MATEKTEPAETFETAETDKIKLKNFTRGVRVVFPNSERTGTANMVDQHYIFIISIRIHPTSKKQGEVFSHGDFAKKHVQEVRDACTDEVLFEAPRTCNKYIGYAIDYLQQAVKSLETLHERNAPNDEAITALDLDDLDRLRNSFNSLKMAENYYAKIRTEIPRINR